MWKDFFGAAVAFGSICYIYKDAMADTVFRWPIRVGIVTLFSIGVFLVIRGFTKLM